VRQRRRKRAYKKTVDEDEPGAVAQEERLDLSDMRRAPCGVCELELDLGDRRDVREAPRFLLGGREAQLAKARNGAFAQVLEPGWGPGRAVRREFPVRLDQPLDRHHHDTMAPARSQS